MNITQLKLEIQNTYRKDEKLTTDFEPINNEDVITRAFLDEKLLTINGHLSLSEKDHNDFLLKYNKQSVEETSIQRAVKTTIQILYDKRLFDNFPNANDVLNIFLFVTRRRDDLEELIDVIQ